MDILTKFWERQARWMAKVDGYAAFVAIICVVLSMLTIDSDKPFGFVAMMLAMWCFGIQLVYALWHVNENGDSRIRNASPLLQFISSVFYVIWFVGLTFISMVLYAKISS